MKGLILLQSRPCVDTGNATVAQLEQSCHRVKVPSPLSEPAHEAYLIPREAVKRVDAGMIGPSESDELSIK
ncbi:unnamed protein product [Caretta caretta]